MKQKFKLGSYTIIEEQIEGLCDTPGTPGKKPKLGMSLWPGNSFKSLRVAIHEALHAEGIPDEYLDGERDCSVAVARLLKRLDWKRE